MRKLWGGLAGLCALVLACGTSSSGDGTTDAGSEGGGGGDSGGVTSTGDAGTDSSAGGDGGGPGTLAACSKYCIPSTYCSGDGGPCTPPSQCTTDADCPAKDKVYSSNGSRCVSICGDHRRCRKPCTTDDDCKPTPTATANTCSGIADDGTRYCEIGLTACPTGVCPQYTTCWPSFRPGG